MSGNQIPQEEQRKPKRNAKGQLLPGERLNGSGLERYKARMKNQLDQLTPRAIARLGQLIDDDSSQVALGACREILDRNLGKVKASIDLKVESSMSELHLQSLIELSQRAHEARAARMIDVTPTVKPDDMSYDEHVATRIDRMTIISGDD
jgi:hypothetical protein